jgi:hypothetical protein
MKGQFKKVQRANKKLTLLYSKRDKIEADYEKAYKLAKDFQRLLEQADKDCELQKDKTLDLAGL